MTDSGVTQDVAVEPPPVCLSSGVGAGMLGAGPGALEVALMVRGGASPTQRLMPFSYPALTPCSS